MRFVLNGNIILTFLPLFVTQPYIQNGEFARNYINNQNFQIRLIKMEAFVKATTKKRYHELQICNAVISLRDTNRLMPQFNGTRSTTAAI